MSSSLSKLIRPIAVLVVVVFSLSGLLHPVNASGALSGTLGHTTAMHNHDFAAGHGNAPEHRQHFVALCLAMSSITLPHEFALAVIKSAAVLESATSPTPELTIITVPAPPPR